ncbi:MAG TPA: tripartite tricarboxylate transporter TctB family protein [Paracoccus sp.]|nr:tripartite tricarboxylate transporter TctB family protein [Paracoccus sp. (in: a-proteobacteria)]
MQRDWPDLIGGLALAALGLGAAGWAVAHYNLGSLRQMGPGFFPAALGTALFVLGMVVALPALKRTGVAPKVEIGATVAVLGSIVIFALGLYRLGLVGTTLVTVLVATLPAPRRGWVWRVVLAVAVTMLTVVVFSYGLRMTLPLWPRLS